MGIFGILPASAAGVLLSVWGEHSASLILLICVIIFFIFATLGLSFLGYVEETRVRSSSRRAIDRSAPPLTAHAQQPPQFDIETFVERWFADYFPGTEVARHTPAWAIVYNATQDLKKRLREVQEAIRIEIGEGAPFDQFRQSLHTQTHLIKRAGRTTSSGGVGGAIEAGTITANALVAKRADILFEIGIVSLPRNPARSTVLPARSGSRTAGSRLAAERARYEAQRAERRYRAVDAENRLVTRGLESEWEQRLRELEQAKAELARRERERPRVLNAVDRRRLLALGADLQSVSEAPTHCRRKLPTWLAVKR